MTVQAKFWVSEIKHHGAYRGQGDEAATIEMKPVFGEGDNADWSKYTPSGKIEMTVTNPAAIEQFELGEEYLLTFDKVE